jgi:hypothetical protein
MEGQFSLSFFYVQHSHQLSQVSSRGHIYNPISKRQSNPNANRIQTPIQSSCFKMLLRSLPSSSKSSIYKGIKRYTKRFSTQQQQQQQSPPLTPTPSKYAKTRAGSGSADLMDPTSSMIPRGPVSWASLGLAAVVAASAVGYYQIERERRLEEAMGKIVSCNY